jgi:integrase
MKTSEPINLSILKNHLENLDLTKADNLTFWLYCQIAMYSGLRARDIIKLKTEDIDFDKKCIRIIETKTKKVSKIPFDRPQILERINKKYPYVIFNPIRGKNLSIMTINRNLKEIYNLDKTISSHSIRKAAALLVYEGTDKDIFKVMKFLNHSSIATTQRYLSISENERNELFNLL